MTDSLEIDREFVVIRALLLRVYTYNKGDNRWAIHRMNRREHFKDLSQVKSLGILPSPPPMLRNQSRSNSRDSCNFHNDEGHKIEDYSSLKDLIEETVMNGELKDFMAWDATLSGQTSRGDNKDMPSVDLQVIVHRLNVSPEIKPIKQKKKRFAPQVIEAKRQEVSNVVMVKKTNGKWRICIDFTNLIKACPNDSFSLPSIDRLVDASSGHKFMSFMDTFSGYNQIFMALEDQDKTTIIKEEKFFYYRVMPFGLKNTCATYQRLVNKIFRKQIECNVEVYFDDMLVKSSTLKGHMKLNMEKCVFGVRASKFLSFLVSEMGRREPREDSIHFRYVSPEDLQRYSAPKREGGCT
ncbi:uncharacterized protein LOC108488270 [Gossypium arboreum]|uniref:uncharacterized protein LOC108488270 n=1 Tax=Gossypium arboreum TaxID=29729 RepID=UPI0008194C89|nr:uncharacterized protein LOC108488270 [Gossypium arboreum]